MSKSFQPTTRLTINSCQLSRGYTSRPGSLPQYTAPLYCGPPSTYAGIIQRNLQRHTASLTEDPTTRWAVVLDDAISGEPADQVIAAIKYNVFQNAEAEAKRKDAGERTWPEGTNVALVDEFWNGIVKSRQQHGKELGAHMSVDLLMTDPKHHRRGAGRLLVRHAVERADELGIPAMLEASPEGLKLYESVGFKEVDHFWINLQRYENGGEKGEEPAKAQGEPGKTNGWYRQVIMLRPAQTDKA